MLAYRAEHQTLEAAVAPGTDHQQVGVSRLLDEYLCSGTLLDTRLTSTGGSSPSTFVISWRKSSGVRWLGSGTYLSDTLTLPVGGGMVCSQAFTTTRSARWSEASAAAHARAL